MTRVEVVNSGQTLEEDAATREEDAVKTVAIKWRMMR
jgi:hypothetical protein